MLWGLPAPAALKHPLSPEHTLSDRSLQSHTSEKPTNLSQVPKAVAEPENQSGVNTVTAASELPHSVRVY